MSDLSVLIPFARKDELSKKYMLSWNGATGFWVCGNERIYNMTGIKPFHIKFLDVHFVNKDTAKTLGCKWSPTHKKWCIAIGNYNSNPLKYEALASKTIPQVEINYDAVVDEDEPNNTIL